MNQAVNHYSITNYGSYGNTEILGTLKLKLQKAESFKFRFVEPIVYNFFYFVFQVN